MDNRAFMTYNGLKVRLDFNFCAQYIEEKSIIPWFTSIEAFDSMRGDLSVICAIVMIFLHQDPIYSGIEIAIVYFFGFAISQSYFLMVSCNLIYGLFYMIYSFLDKFFIPYIVLVTVSIILNEFKILIAFIIVRLICFAVENTINIIRGKHYYNKYKVYMGDVEITAAKMLQFYSKEYTSFKQWLKEYSNYINN